MDLKNKINTPLSDIQMEKHFKNVILYQDFIELSFKKILNMLPIVILYESKPGFGHWTLLHRYRNNIEFFDSYGFQPDTEFNYVDPRYRLPHKLVEFLLSMFDSFKIHYNQYRFQTMSENIQTCGRWCILRNLLKHIDIDKFAEAVDSLSIEVKATPDELVTIIVND